jgi:hypothetical protein
MIATVVDNTSDGDSMAASAGVVSTLGWLKQSLPRLSRAKAGV